MIGQEPELGTVVLSRAGRDAGRHFVVVGVADGHHVLIADGDLRKLASPKKKKLRHLEVKPAGLPAVREKLEKGVSLLDAELRRGLEALGYAKQRQGSERE